MTTVELGSTSISTMNSVDNITVSSQINDADGDSSKKKEEEEELEKLAMNEILIETKRRAETAREFGALGWQKSPLLPVNKQFLKNTLVSTLRSVPDIKKDKKIREPKIWKNPEYKRSYRRRNSSSDTESSKSRRRDTSKLDEKDKSLSRDSSRRYRLGQPSNNRHVPSRHSDRRSSKKDTCDTGSGKNSDLSVNKNDVKPAADLTQTEQKGSNSVENGSKENSQVKSDSKNESLTLGVKEETVVDNDLKSKDEEQNLPNKQAAANSDDKHSSRSVKRKRSKTRGEKEESSKRRKHHGKHKKDSGKKHKSKKRSKKHKKKDSET